MQQIKSYTNYQEFWHFAKPILLQHEAHNNLSLGIALRVEDKPEQLKLGLVLFVDGQASKVAIISAFQGGTLILSHTWELADLCILHAFLISNEVALHGVVAQVKLSEKLPINRGKGYGRALITMICAQIFKSGKIPLLFVDKNNPLTLHLYYSLGFAAISETKHYIFKFT